MTAKEIEKITRLQQDGYGYKRIAAVTGLSVNTVKSYCRRHPLAETKDTEQDGICRFCGKKLVQTPHKRKRCFCSDACRMDWWNAHPEKVNRKAVYTFLCAYCGQPFESYGNEHRKFCSRRCFGLSRRKEANR